MLVSLDLEVQGTQNYRNYSIQYTNETKCFLSATRKMTYVLHVDFHASFAQIHFRFPEYFSKSFCENLKFFFNHSSPFLLKIV